MATCILYQIDTVSQQIMLLCFLVVLRQCAYLIEVDTWLIWGDKRMYWKEFISRYVVTMTSWHVWHCNRKKTRLWLTYFIKVTTPSKRVPTQYRPRSYCRPCRIILLWRSDVVEMIVDLSFWSMVDGSDEQLPQPQLQPLRMEHQLHYDDVYDVWSTPLLKDTSV